MAIIIPGPLTSAISGNLGGQNFVQGKHGPYIRKRLTRCKSQTDIQLDKRARFTTFSNAWQTLTDEQRTTWDTTARQHKFTNRLGIPRNLSGFQLYLKTALNQNPDVYSAPTIPGATFRQESPTSMTLTFAEGGPFTTIVEPKGVVAGRVTRIYGWRPINTRTWRHVPQWKYVTYFPCAPAGANIYTAFVALFGTPEAGETIYIKAELYHALYLAGAPIIDQTTVT